MMRLLRDPVTGDLARQPECSPGYDGWQDLGVAPETPPVADSYDADAGVAAIDTDALLASLRAERDARLRACDWTQLPDVPSAIRLAWQPYRQALRDAPETLDPFDPDWPSPPEQE